MYPLPNFTKKNMRRAKNWLFPTLGWLRVVLRRQKCSNIYKFVFLNVLKDGPFDLVYYWRNNWFSKLNAITCHLFWECWVIASWKCGNKPVCSPFWLDSEEKCEMSVTVAVIVGRPCVLLDLSSPDLAEVLGLVGIWIGVVEISESSFWLSVTCNGSCMGLSFCRFASVGLFFGIFLFPSFLFPWTRGAWWRGNFFSD